jgi:hypothetical protein
MFSPNPEGGIAYKDPHSQIYGHLFNPVPDPKIAKNVLLAYGKKNNDAGQVGGAGMLYRLITGDLWNKHITKLPASQATPADLMYRDKVARAYLDLELMYKEEMGLMESSASSSSGPSGGSSSFRAAGPMAYLSKGGLARGTDTIPAMLTPGEFIMSKYAVNTYGVDTMKAINSGEMSSSSVYNSYAVNVNVRSDANPDQIARAVMGQIRQVNSQQLRGNRF